MLTVDFDRLDLRARIGAAGRTRALDNFTWRQTAIGTVEHYRALLDERAANGHA